MHKMTVLLLLSLAVLPAQAEIYRWVDEQGRVHFGERPIQGAERVEVQPQVIQRDDQVRQREENLQRIMDVRSQERAAEQQQRAEQRARNLAWCERMGKELARFDKRIYWYEEDASGKKVEVDRQRVEQKRSELKKQIEERC